MARSGREAERAGRVREQPKSHAPLPCPYGCGKTARERNIPGGQHLTWTRAKPWNRGT